MKLFAALFVTTVFSSLCFAAEKLPVDFPLQFPDSELNREYVKGQRQVVSYKTKLSYEKVCVELSRLLGEGWVKRTPSKEEALAKQKLLSDPAQPFVGFDTFINDKYPSLTVTIAQVQSPENANGYPYFLTTTIGPIPEQE